MIYSWSSANAAWWIARVRKSVVSAESFSKYSYPRRFTKGLYSACKKHMSLNYQAQEVLESYPTKRIQRSYQARPFPPHWHQSAKVLCDTVPYQDYIVNWCSESQRSRILPQNSHSFSSFRILTNVSALLTSVKPARERAKTSWTRPMRSLNEKTASPLAASVAILASLLGVYRTRSGGKEGASINIYRLQNSQKL